MPLKKIAKELLFIKRMPKLYYTLMCSLLLFYKIRARDWSKSITWL